MSTDVPLISVSLFFMDAIRRRKLGFQCKYLYRWTYVQMAHFGSTVCFTQMFSVAHWNNSDQILRENFSRRESFFLFFSFFLFHFLQSAFFFFFLIHWMNFKSDLEDVFMKDKETEPAVILVVCLSPWLPPLNINNGITALLSFPPFL